MCGLIGVWLSDVWLICSLIDVWKSFYIHLPNWSLGLMHMPIWVFDLNWCMGLILCVAQVDE